MNPRNPHDVLPGVDPTLLPLLEEEARRHPDWADVQNRCGLAHLAAGNLDAALVAFQRALDRNPGYGWAALNRACTLALLERPAEAREALAQAPEAAPGSRGRVKDFLTLLGTHPPAPLDPRPSEGERLDVLRLRAALARIAGRETESEQLWQRAQTCLPAGLLPADASPWGSEGDPKGRALTFLPGLHELYLAQSTIEARLRRRESAERSAGFSHLLWSEEGTYLCQLGEIASVLGDDDEAFARYEAAARSAPGDPRPHAALAFLWSAAGEVEPAREALREALRNAPRYADLHYQLALVECARADLEGALASLEEALRINPRYAVARLESAHVLCILERWEEARAATLHVRKEGVASADIALQLGRIELALGHPDAAEAAWKEALELAPADGAVLRELGRLFRSQGRRAEAKEIWKELLDVGVEEEPEELDRASGDDI